MAASARNKMAVKVISGRVRELEEKLPQREFRSLCEVPLNKNDYDNLSKWAKQGLSPQVCKLAGWKAGVIILHLISEACRREAYGGAMWSLVAEKFSPDIREILFTGDAPKRLLKGWIKKAAKELKLRHAFGEEDTKPWYLTTHLQFGFSRPSFEEHLPEWLSGYMPPKSVEWLLSGEMASDSFQELWFALRYFRKQRIPEPQLRQVIRNSPWVLAEWEEDLVRLSREKLDLEDYGDDHEQVLLPEVELVSEPVLVWDRVSDPVFRCEVKNLDLLGRTTPHYHLEVNGSHTTTLFKQQDNTYKALPEEFDLDAGLPQACCSLVEENGDVYLTQLVEVWDPSSDINVFEESSGRPVDHTAGSMSPDKTYYLLLQPDLLLEPADLPWQKLGTRFLFELPRGWGPEATRVVTRDGTTIWTPPLRHSSGDRSIPAALQNVRMRVPPRDRTVSLGGQIHPQVHGLPEGSALEYVRCQGGPIAFDKQTGRIDPVEIDPDMTGSAISFDLGVRLAAAEAPAFFSLSKKKLELRLTGTAQHRPRGWHVIEKERTLTARDARESYFRVFPPWAGDGDEREGHHNQAFAIMEGTKLLRWRSKKAATLGPALGTGAPIVAKKGPYNSTEDLFIIRGVADRGVIRRIRHNPQSCDLQLTHPIEMTLQHRVLLWHFGDREPPREIGPENITTCQKTACWNLSGLSQDLRRGAILAISYKGKWLGSCIDGNVEDLLESLDGYPMEKSELAALILWFRLPVLQRDTPGEEPPFSAFVRSCPEVILSCWSGKTEIPMGLVHDRGPQRRDVEALQLRELFLGWAPTTEQSIAIVTGLAENDQDPLGEVMLTGSRLLFDLPLLAGHLMRHWLKTKGLPPSCPPSLYFTSLKKYFLSQLSVATGSPTEMDARNELLSQAAKGMPVGPADSDARSDEGFVREAIAVPALKTLEGAPLDELEEDNLAVALQHAPFRHYLAFCILLETERRF